MRTTVNQLYAEQHAIQQGHLQLQKGEFFPGAFQRAVYERVVRYPLHCVYYNTGGINKRTNQITLFIIVADRVYKDYNNLNDTKSDTKQCVEDIVDIMTHSRRWNKIGRVESAPVSLFIDGKADEVTGHMATVTLTLFDRKALCDLPMLNYDFDGSLASRCEPVTITDSDGITVVEIPSGSQFVCTPIEPFDPVTGQNSDNSFSFTADSGENVPLLDIEVETGSGTLTFPSNKDLDLSNYFRLTPQTGTRIPVNTVTDPLTQVAWYGGTSNVSTGTGFVEKITGGTGFNASKTFTIDTYLDFKIEFAITAGTGMVGCTFVDLGPGYNDISFCLYWFGSGYNIYQSSTFIGGFPGSIGDALKIEYSGGSVKYYSNNVLKQTQVMPSAIHGKMLFDCSLSADGAKVENILLTYL